MLFRKKTEMVDESDALAGRTDQTMGVPDTHFVNGNPLVGPWPDGFQMIVFGMGCFWGAERMFWQLDGVYSTFAGYAGGFTPNPGYEEVCSGQTGHNEVVGVVFDPDVITEAQLLQTFWEGHDPTQGMRQGNDVGTQYRSAIYLTDESQRAAVESTRSMFEERLHGAGFGAITTEIKLIDPATEFFYAEPNHQQFLAKKLAAGIEGYCGLGGTGVSCPIGVLDDDD